MNNAPDIRWQRRFENFKLAYMKLQQAILAHQNMPGDELIHMALIKAFEMIQ